MKFHHPVRMAILDMNNNVENMGIASIQRIADRFAVIDYEVFDVRYKREIPGLDFDIYISSGGPGDPLDGDGVWDKEYFDLMDQLWEHNKHHAEKKFVFFVCHSFQMICHHMGIGTISLRRKESFGILPVDKTDEGQSDPLLMHLNSPFYGADFRRYEVIYPNADRLKELDATVTALENPDLDIDENRALMAVRFSKEWFGTQFHPEAHPDGMVHYLRRPEKKEMILSQFGLNTYEEMMHNALHPDRLAHTRDIILPGFLKDAMDRILAYSKEGEPVFV
ncbi:MAG: GMP synthase [Saprospiraceae bacterium]|nr:GMP synthase [Candidatus Opimibacter skivensis]